MTASTQCGSDGYFNKSFNWIIWGYNLLVSETLTLKIQFFLLHKKNCVFIPFVFWRTSLCGMPCSLWQFHHSQSLIFMLSLIRKNTLQMSLCFKRRECRMEGGYLVGKSVCCASMRSWVPALRTFMKKLGMMVHSYSSSVEEEEEKEERRRRRRNSLDLKGDRSPMEILDKWSSRVLAKTSQQTKDRLKCSF